MSLKHILLISYTFPPNPGIGGRRWAKFAKYLAKSGYIVHVICAKNEKKKEESLWINDIKNISAIKRYDLESKYPEMLNMTPKSISEKFKYKIALSYVEFISKGSPYDRGIFWENSLIKKSTELIKDYNIKNIIVSCAPFSTAYFSVELKKRFPDIKLMIDFRDPWTWGTGYGFSNLSEKRMSYEKQQERKVVEKADVIFVPTDIMKEYLQKTYLNEAKKINLLPHGFDKEEILNCEKQIASNRIKIIFYGSLYEGIGNYISILSDELKKLKEEAELHIYSDSLRYSKLFETNGLLNANVFFHSPLSPEELFNEMNGASFVLLIHPDYGINNISTKFFEIIYSKTPILYLGKKGLTSEFILKNKIGFTFEELEIAENFSKTILNKQNESYNSNFDVEEYSFDNLCNKSLISQFKV